MTMSSRQARFSGKNSFFCRKFSLKTLRILIAKLKVGHHARLGEHNHLVIGTEENTPCCQHVHAKGIRNYALLEGAMQFSEITLKKIQSCKNIGSFSCITNSVQQFFCIISQKIVSDNHMSCNSFFVAVSQYKNYCFL